MFARDRQLSVYHCIRLFDPRLFWRKEHHGRWSFSEACTNYMLGLNSLRVFSRNKWSHSNSFCYAHRYYIRGSRCRLSPFTTWPTSGLQLRQMKCHWRHLCRVTGYHKTEQKDRATERKLLLLEMFTNANFCKKVTKLTIANSSFQISVIASQGRHFTTIRPDGFCTIFVLVLVVRAWAIDALVWICWKIKLPHLLHSH